VETDAVRDIATAREELLGLPERIVTRTPQERL
jgi:hypothetical protein